MVKKNFYSDWGALKLLFNSGKINWLFCFLFSLFVLDLKETIQFWANELLNPTSNDLLVNISDSKRFYSLKENHGTNLSLDKALKKIVLEARSNKRNTGIDSFCRIEKVVVWTWKGKERHTPLLLTPTHFKEDKISKSLKIDQSETVFFNPFLVKTLSEVVDFEKSTEEVCNLLLACSVVTRIEPIVGLANVHHHRFSIVKELELLAEKEVAGSNLSKLLGFGSGTEETINLSGHSIFRSDKDQEAVFKVLKADNTVVEGPPGTGKSQVIANLLVKSVAANNKTLLLAEKPVALAVVYEKLKQFNLHYLCSIYAGNKSNAIHISSLEKSYNFIEQYAKKPTRNLFISQQKLSALQLKMDTLNTSNVIGGVDYSTFKKILGNRSIDKTKLDISAPDIKEWLQVKPIIEKIFKNQASVLAWTKIKHLKSFNLEQIERLSTEIGLYLNTLYDLDLTPESVEKQLKEIYFTQLFYFSGKEVEIELLKKNSPTQKRFYKLYRTFLKQKAQIELLEKETQIWKRALSASEISDFIAALASANKFNLKTRRKRKALSKLSTVQLSNFTEALENLKQFEALKAKQIEVEDKLRKLKIDPTESNLLALNSLLDRVNGADQNEIFKLAELSSEQRKLILEKEKQITEIHQWIKQFSLHRKEPILQQLLEIKKSLPSLVTHLSVVKTLSPAFLDILSRVRNSSELEEIICVSAFVKFESLHPFIQNFDGEVLMKEIETILKLQEQEFKDFAESILFETSQKFSSYHTLLNTPASQLDEEQKAIKVTLRKGKALLVKEFGKSKQHKSPLELNASEASIWIDLLQPIKLLSTYQLATDFPLENESFDLVVFDEASQLPLANSFGGIYRSKRVLIAGDTQQMSPTTFFKADFDAVDLLHQAQYHFKKTKLTHHYRSKHPALIAFSNENFYENRLKTFQAYSKKNPVEVINCKGVYSSLGNIKEAEKVAEMIAEKFANNHLDFGVVTFNEKQLKLIYSKLSDENKEILDECIENGLVFKALENVQGDECSHLIISLGFAHNKEGKFDMRFGPINQESGAKRLNVLFSRAQAKLTFVCSVTASDFKISENLGVDLLRRFILFQEQQNGERLIFPENLEIVQQEDKLHIPSPFAYFKDGISLITYFNVMQNRGWHLSFDV